MPIALTFVLGGVLTGTSYAGAAALLAAVLVTQSLLVAYWHVGVRAPGVLGGAVLALGAGAGAAVAFLTQEDGPKLGTWTGILGAATVAVFVHQLLRRNRSHAMASMSATAALVLLTMLVALYLAALELADGDAVAVVVLAAAAARVPEMAALPPRAGIAGALAAGGAGGLAAGAATGLQLGFSIGAGVVAAFGSALSALLMQRMSGATPLLSAAMTMSFVAPVAYAFARLTAG